jgi:hypothetical protein
MIPDQQADTSARRDHDRKAKGTLPTAKRRSRFDGSLSRLDQRARVTVYELYEPVCCIRVAFASPATVLAAFAAGATATATPRAAMAARTRFFIVRSPTGRPRWIAERVLFVTMQKTGS